MRVLLNKQVGDSVWLMYNDQAVPGIINRVHYRQYVSKLDFETVNTIEMYTVSIKNHTGGSIEISCKKDEVYPDKESLIKSL